MEPHRSEKELRAQDDRDAMRDRISKARADMVSMIDRIRDPETLKVAQDTVKGCDAFLRQLDAEAPTPASR